MYNEQNCQNGKMNRGCGPKGRGFGGPFGRGPFGNHAHSMFGGGMRRVPVNIEDTDNSFILTLFAPALTKENLKVVTKDDLLTISYTPSEETVKSTNFSRKEYSNGTFERAFSLNGKVLAEQINAAYSDGILTVILPKNPDTTTPVKDITVS